MRRSQHRRAPCSMLSIGNDEVWYDVVMNIDDRHEKLLLRRRVHTAAHGGQWEKRKLSSRNP